MSQDYSDEIRLIVESLKLQQSLLASLYHFCEGKKADRTSPEPMRQEALEIRAEEAKAKMRKTSDEVTKKIAELEAKLQQMGK